MKWRSRSFVARILSASSSDKKPGARCRRGRPADCQSRRPRVLRKASATSNIRRSWELQEGCTTRGGRSFVLISFRLWNSWPACARVRAATEAVAARWRRRPRRICPPTRALRWSARRAACSAAVTLRDDCRELPRICRKRSVSLASFSLNRFLLNLHLVITYRRNDCRKHPKIVQANIHDFHPSGIVLLRQSEISNE